MTTQHIGTPQRLPIDELTPYHQNPRRGDVTAIADSLRAHGQFRPLVVNKGTHTDRPFEVLAGNHTLLAALSLDGSGHEFRTMDCYVVDVSADEARRIVLADNRTSDLGAYDDAALLDMLQGMDDLDGTGYDDDAVAGLLDAMADEDERIEFAAGALADDDDGPESGPAGAAGGTTGGEGGTAPGMERQAASRTLAARFIVPPFTVIDTRGGAWRTRKRAWIAQGIQSTVGRDEALTFTGLGKWANWMEVAGRARAAHPGITEAEIEKRYADDLRPLASGSGTSEFDPVLAEVLYTWFSAPGHRVLDPWAGGSVRGIVAAALGRDYVGCELRPEQVDANQQQWEATRPNLAPVAAALHALQQAEPVTDDPAALTPVQQVGDYYVKRDDLFAIGGSRGGKVRTCLHLAHAARATGAHTLVTAGSRHSPQVNIVAAVAEHTGMTAQVHIPDGAATPEIDMAEAAGADVHRHRPGYNSVIVRRAADAAAEPGCAEIPFGMEHPLAVEYTAAQVANLPADVTRIVMPAGSGMSLAGVLTGLQQQGRDDVTVTAVTVGADPTARLDEYAPEGWRDRVELVEADVPYDTAPADTYLQHISLDPHYEAKCLPHLQPGDLLWVVGIRATAAPDRIPAAAAGGDPDGAEGSAEWVTGDSRTTMRQMDTADPFDFVIGCPPYYDLEEYSDDPADLSTMSTAEFDAAMTDTLRAADALLADDSFAAFVVGPVRDPRGHLRDMKSLMIRAADEVGWHYVNDAVLLNATGTAAIRAGRPFAATRTLTRVHQDVVVFVKGDRRAATARCGTVEVADLPAADTPEEE